LGLAIKANPANVGQLRNRLVSAEQQIRVVGLGVAGLIALAFGNLTPLIASDAPRWLMGVLVTLVVVAAGLLARAWIAMRNAAADVDGLDGTDVLTEDPANKAFSTYKLGRAIFRIALGVIVVAGLCYLAATWIWVTAPSRSALSSEHARAACLTTEDCQAATWPGRKNGVQSRYWRGAVCRAQSGCQWDCAKIPKFRPGFSEPAAAPAPAKVRPLVLSRRRHVVRSGLSGQVPALRFLGALRERAAVTLAKRNDARNPAAPDRQSH
jgi:hypothetical protein